MGEVFHGRFNKTIPGFARFSLLSKQLRVALRYGIASVDAKLRNRRDPEFDFLDEESEAAFKAVWPTVCKLFSGLDLELAHGFYDFLIQTDEQTNKLCQLTFLLGDVTVASTARLCFGVELMDSTDFYKRVQEERSGKNERPYFDGWEPVFMPPNPGSDYGVKPYPDDALDTVKLVLPLWRSGSIKQLVENFDYLVNSTNSLAACYSYREKAEGFEEETLCCKTVTYAVPAVFTTGPIHRISEEIENKVYVINVVLELPEIAYVRQQGRM